MIVDKEQENKVLEKVFQYSIERQYKKILENYINDVEKYIEQYAFKTHDPQHNIFTDVKFKQFFQELLEVFYKKEINRIITGQLLPSDAFIDKARYKEFEHYYLYELCDIHIPIICSNMDFKNFISPSFYNLIEKSGLKNQPLQLILDRVFILDKTTTNLKIRHLDTNKFTDYIGISFFLAISPNLVEQWALEKETKIPSNLFLKNKL